MNKQKVLFGVSILGFGAAALVAGGCLSSSSTNSADAGPSGSSSGGGLSSGAGTSSSSGAGGSTSGGTSSSSSGGSSSGSGGTTFLIDDMSGLENATQGYWYTFSDRTVPNSEPAVITVLADGGTPPGTVTPPEGTAFPPASDQVSLPDGTTANYREFSAVGVSTWGAGFGMDFTSTVPTGSDLTPFASCTTYTLPDGSTSIFDDNAVDAGVVGIVQPYNASAWTGVSFWIQSRGTGTPPKVIVNIDDDQTSPWGSVMTDGGTNPSACGPCVIKASTTPPYECSNSWAYPVPTTTSWVQWKVPFASMKPDSNWNDQGLKLGGIHTQSIYNLHWKFETAAGSALPAVDVAVATIQFYQ